MTTRGLFFIRLSYEYMMRRFSREIHGLCQELELKKQAEFEAKAKEMELKAAEEKAAAAADPRLVEVKERLAKLEETMKEIVAGSKRQSSDPVKEGQGDLNVQRPTVLTKPDNILHGSEGKISEESATPSSEKKMHGIALVTQASQDSKKAA